MVSRRSIGVRTITLLWQLAGVTVSFWGWLFIWQGALFNEPQIFPRYLLYNEFLLIGVIFGFRSNTHHDNGRKDPEFVLANRQTLRQVFLGLFAVLVIEFTVRDMEVSRSFIFSFVPLFYLTLLFANYLLPRTVGKLSFSGVREERVALAGTLEQAVQIKPWLDRKSLIGLRTVGLICGQKTNGTPPPFPVLGTLEKATEILREKSITQVILLDLAPGTDQVRRLTQICEGAAVRLLALHDVSDYFNHTTTVFEDDGVRFIGLRDEPLESPFNRMVKRILDFAVALPVVVLLLPPVMVVVWLIQRLQSPGPLFFKQVRVGLMGQPFRMYKFRTMHSDGGNEAKQASRNDPRIYPAGHWLRKLSIDELPQFLNVLYGNMSVVGPRPHLPKHEEMFAKAMRRYPIRRFIPPGLTGWAQICGFRGEIHSEADIQKRVEADIYYLENWSLSLDCLIILKTIKHCIFPPRSAY
jgi:putative colanic acid biosynthesis UDP-glucose lipid carrier transferase